MDIFEHIKKEHEEVDEMLQNLIDGKSGAEETFGKLRTSLEAHMQAEEASLYPAMSDAEKEMIDHATEEHNESRKVVKKIDSGAKEGDAFMENVNNLAQMIRDHVEEEETKVLPRGQEMFDRSQVDELSKKFDEVDNRIMQKSS